MKTKTVETSLILKNLDADTLKVLAAFEDSKYYETIKNLCRRYAETKKNQILELPMRDERVFAHEAALRKGGVFTLKVLIEIIEEAEKELSKRK